MNCGSIRQPLLESLERMEMYLQYRVRELHMISDEMTWLLQTMGDPETAKRFVQAQYDCGRISLSGACGFSSGTWLDRLRADSSIHASFFDRVRHCMASHFGCRGAIS